MLVACVDLPVTNGSHYSGQKIVPYFGSCALAIMADGTQSVLVAGTAYVYKRSDAVVVHAVEPDGVCPIASVRTTHGTGAAIVAP